MARRPVRLTDIVAGHVSLEIEGSDRIYLSGYVPALQLGGQLAGFLDWRGFPIASPAALGKISQGFRAAVRPATPQPPDRKAPVKLPGECTREDGLD